jgi:uncharacterized protein YbaR (Trm112 family)/SAM-dependent methyltransferase
MNMAHIDAELLGVLICPRCLGLNQERQLRELGSVLFCAECGMSYPIVEGIPILFPDEERIQFVTDKAFQAKTVAKSRLSPYARSRETALQRLSPKALRLLQIAYEQRFFEYWLECANWFLDGQQGQQLRKEEMCTHLRGRHKEFFDHVIANEESVKAKVILNVGAGRDPILELFSERGAYVIEQDILLDSLRYLKKRGALGVCSDLRCLPMRSGSAHIITSFGVIHHVQPISAPLREMARLLRSSGTLYAHEPNALFSSRSVEKFVPLWVYRRPYRSLIAASGPDPFDVGHSPFETAIYPRALISSL